VIASVERDLVCEMVQHGLVSVDPSVTYPIERTALLAVGIERWWSLARQLRQIVRGEELMP
jgi:hypothetical protein